jgi:hypothetical protein
MIVTKTTDHCTLCFRVWNITQAVTMMKAAVAWRKTFQGIGVSHVKEESISNELQSYESQNLDFSGLFLHFIDSLFS